MQNNKPKIWKRILPVFFLFPLLFSGLSSCNSAEPEPPPPKPPGYQEDIPWPSLADSPWPINHGDPQYTGRSSLNGPINGNILWEYSTNEEFDSGITIGPDSCIYFVTGCYSGAGLTVLNPDGSVKKKIELGTVTNLTTPLLTPDKIICCDGFARILAFSYDGTLAWEYEAASVILNESLNIDLNGDIYFTAGGDIYSISNNGIEKWKLILSEEIDMLSSQITISPDSKTLYLPGRNVTVIAVDISTSQIKWKYGNWFTRVPFTVDSDGNLFLALRNGDLDETEIISITDSGIERWKHSSPYRHIRDNSLCINKSGDVFFADDSLYSFTNTGELLWITELGFVCDAPLVCDANGTIFVGGIAVQPRIRIAAFNLDGVKLWEVTEDTQRYVGPSPAIGLNNQLYYILNSYKILAIN